MCVVGFGATLLLPDRTRESITDDSVYARRPARGAPAAEVTAH
jgi:hypothetical protein